MAEESGEVDVLMRDAHVAQIEFLDSKLKLGIVDHFSRWKEFLEITERRNLFVHTGGRVTQQYLQNCRRLGVQVDAKIKDGVILGASACIILKRSKRA